jgi:hypothetical protein
MEFWLFLGILLIPLSAVVIRWSVRFRRRQLSRALQRELAATDSYLERLEGASPDNIDRIIEQEQRRRGD